MKIVTKREEGKRGLFGFGCGLAHASSEGVDFQAHFIRQLVGVVLSIGFGIYTNHILGSRRSEKAMENKFSTSWGCKKMHYFIS